MLGNGLHFDIPESEYHADPCERPSFSASIGHKLLTQSPLHAFLAHPRLNPDREHEEYSKEAAFGSAMHAALLGKDGERVVVLDFDDFKKAAAREARDKFLAMGMIPILKSSHDRIKPMLIAAHKQLYKQPDVWQLIEPLKGDSEVTMIWERDGLPMRARIDWLPRDRAVVVDYKSTNDSAHPDIVGRRLYGTGADLQAAHYCDGLEFHGINVPTMHYVVQETSPPYLLSVVALDGTAMEIARMKLRRARMLWKQCVETAYWPGYPTRTCWISAPGWEIHREEGQPTAPEEVFRTWEDWQRP